MSEENLQDRLEQGMHGTPQLKPDEKRKYLGNFLERVYVVLDFSEVTRPASLQQLKERIKQFPNHQLFINSQVPSDSQKKLVRLAQETGCRFTIVDTSQAENKTDLAVVYAGEQPSKVDSIHLPDLQKQFASETETKKKEAFWHKLFPPSK